MQPQGERHRELDCRAIVALCKQLPCRGAASPKHSPAQHMPFVARQARSTPKAQLL